MTVFVVNTLIRLVNGFVIGLAKVLRQEQHSSELQPAARMTDCGTKVTNSDVCCHLT